MIKKQLLLKIIEDLPPSFTTYDLLEELKKVEQLNHDSNFNWDYDHHVHSFMAQFVSYIPNYFEANRIMNKTYLSSRSIAVFDNFLLKNSVDSNELYEYGFFDCRAWLMRELTGEQDEKKLYPTIDF